MTRDDIIRMAREAGFNTNREMIWINGWEISPYMQRFATLVAAAEREACAKVCDKWYEAACRLESERRTHHYLMGKGARSCAHAIRTRGQQ